MSLEGLRISLLGPVQCFVDGTAIALGSSRRAALLVLLALRSPHSVCRAELVDGLWGEHAPKAAVNSLQVMVSTLRKVVGGDAIVTEGSGYRLTPTAWVDVTEFEGLLARGQQQVQRGDNVAGAETLRASLALWRGSALVDLADAPFTLVETVRLEELRITALSARIGADLALGRHQDVVAELQALVAQYPLREGFREMLMLGLYRGGRQAEALAAYDSGRRILRDQVGAEPAPALQALHRRLLDQAEPTPPAAQLRRRQVPGPLDATVGRAKDLDELEALLLDATVRLVTVLGPGGVGKTRLGLEVGSRLGEMFRDGAAYVPLTEASAPTEVAAVICAALGFRASEDPFEFLVTALQARQMLLVCDNFEHVAEAATMLSTLLAAAPGLKVLTTSRQPLGLRGEQLFRLEPLPVYPPSEGASDAAQLFVTRARSRDRTFAPAGAEWSEIEEICRRCDGLPLAIELAAARIPLLSLGELVQRLSLPFLGLRSEARDLSTRQRSLSANLAWSVDALPPAARRILPRLTVFRGGLTVAGAGAVSGLDDDSAQVQLEILLDRSLLKASSSSGGGRRLDLLDTVRQFANEMLDDDDEAEARHRHAEFFRRKLTLEQEPSPRVPTAGAWTWLVHEQANLRVAVQWALKSPEGELAADLVVGATGLWDLLGPRDEMERWSDIALARDDISAGRRADLLFGRAWLSIYRGDLETVTAALSEARGICEAIGDTRRLAWVLGLGAWAAASEGESGAALPLADRALELAKLHPDAVVLQYGMLNMLAVVGPGADALERNERTLRFCREHSLDLHALAEMVNVGESALECDQVARAAELADEGIALSIDLGLPDMLAHHLSQRGAVRLLRGLYEGARADLRLALAGHLEQGSLTYALNDIERLAAAEAADEPARAAELLGVVDGAQGVTSPWRERSVGDYYLEPHLADLPFRLGLDYDGSHRRGRQRAVDLGLAGALSAIEHSAAVEGDHAT